MQGTRAVQVVLGEGEPGILRLILEAQGFEVVGHARDDDELRRVVAVTRPTVIVLDAGISALAVVDTQVRSDYVPIVVVWPKDTYSSAAEERVDPATAFLELGNVVRRVAERHTEPIRVPEADDEEPSDPIDAQPPASPDRRRGAGRLRHALVVVGAWTIALTALAAIGLAVPSAFRAFEPVGSLHPLRDRPEGALTADREGSGRPAVDVDHEPPCARREEVRVGPHPGRGDAVASGSGCALGHAKHGDPGPRGRGQDLGQGDGRPDDPGKGSGRGDDEGGGAASNETTPKHETRDRDGAEGDHATEDDPPVTDDDGGSGRGREAGGSDRDGGGGPSGAGNGSWKDEDTGKGKE